MCLKNGSLSEIDIAVERSYPTPYANSPLLPLLLLSLLRQRIAPKVATTFRKEYDYIIVGGGSAGSVVAGRLSEEPCVSVLLLEAGGKPPLLTDVPGLARSFYFTNIDWKYKTVPQKNTARALVNRQVVWPSGKGLGGSSLFSAMVYSRGNRKNYDDWAEQGAAGWSYAEVLPYFIKLENNRDFEFVANGCHGVGGPVSVEKPRYNSEIKDPVLEAAQQFGYQIVDPNAAQQTGSFGRSSGCWGSIFSEWLYARDKGKMRSNHGCGSNKHSSDFDALRDRTQRTSSKVHYCGQSKFTCWK